MYLAQSIGNVLQKFNNQKINILYEPYDNMIDILLGLCGIDLYVLRKENKSRKIDKNIAINLINNDQLDLFNYNIGIANNILEYATNQKFSGYHINTLIFIPNNKPQAFKKEDLLLLNSNLSKMTKVVFSQYQNDSWKFQKSEIISYGIPNDLFFIEETESRRTNKVLLLNFNNINNEGVRVLAHILSNQQIDYDIVNELPYNIESIRKMFNSYPVCVELNDRNISNLLVGLSCGCCGIFYDINNLVSSYGNIPNLYFNNNLNEIVTKIRDLLNKENNMKNSTEYLKKNMDFETFRNSITKLISKVNRETFYL